MEFSPTTIEILNPTFNPATSTYHATLVHPEFGEIPFSTPSVTADEVGQVIVARIVSQGFTTLEPALNKTLLTGTVDAIFADFLSRFTVGAPVQEISSWSAKAAAAEAYLAGNTNQPILANEAAAAGLPLPELVAKVKANADRYIEIVAKARGLKTFANTQLATTTTITAAEEVINNFIVSLNSI